MATLAKINARIARDVSPLVELVRGEGYLYFVYDDGGPKYETKSIMVPYLNCYSAHDWVQEAAQFAADLGE